MKKILLPDCAPQRHYMPSGARSAKTRKQALNLPCAQYKVIAFPCKRLCKLHILRLILSKLTCPSFWLTDTDYLTIIHGKIQYFQFQNNAVKSGCRKNITRNTRRHNRNISFLLPPVSPSLSFTKTFARNHPKAVPAVLVIKSLTSVAR